MKRNATSAQLNWPTSYNRALKRRRLMRSRGAYIMSSGQRAAVTPGYTRTAGAYRRSQPQAAEKKYWDVQVTNVGDMTSGSVLNSLNLIPQGTTDQKRIGNKITIRNINIRGQFSLDDQGTGAFTSCIMRVILFVDKQCNGATATVADILTTADINSFRNMDQVERFVILKDKNYTLPVTAANVLHTSDSTRTWNISKKCNYDVHFSSTTGAITEIRSNNVGLLYITSNTIVNAEGIARIKFTDY